MPAFQNLIGRRFGKLVVVRQGTHSTCGRVRWVCKCDCGKFTITQANNLISNNQKNCPCGWVSGGALKHGHGRVDGRSGTFRTWLSMRRRCKEHVLYIKNNISVCERWASFGNFLEDMGERPSGCTIDRIDGSKGYEPGNCRWATAKQQAQNRPGFVYTEDEVNEIVGRLEHGESVSSIHKRLGVPLVTIRRFKKKFGVK